MKITVSPECSLRCDKLTIDDPNWYERAESVEKFASQAQLKSLGLAAIESDDVNRGIGHCPSPGPIDIGTRRVKECNMTLECFPEGLTEEEEDTVMRILSGIKLSPNLTRAA